jgi:hypothetical protein
MEVTPLKTIPAIGEKLATPPAKVIQEAPKTCLHVELESILLDHP